jgi:hypothetical protein
MPLETQEVAHLARLRQRPAQRHVGETMRDLRSRQKIVGLVERIGAASIRPSIAWKWRISGLACVKSAITNDKRAS